MADVHEGSFTMSLAGSFLVAEPGLQDPNFKQTVVLILAHNDDGAFGLVINRPTQKANLPIPVFEGGPCPAPGLIMLHGHADWVEPSAEADLAEDEADESQREVAPGIFLGNPACLKLASKTPKGEAMRLRAFEGYAGWGPGQLEAEMKHGGWQVMPADGELLFDEPVEKLWQLLAPPSLPRPSVN